MTLDVGQALEPKGRNAWEAWRSPILFVLAIVMVAFVFFAPFFTGQAVALDGGQAAIFGIILSAAGLAVGHDGAKQP